VIEMKEEGKGLHVKNRIFAGKTFMGTELVTWIDRKLSNGRNEAIQVAKSLLEERFIVNQSQKSKPVFRDDNSLYHFMVLCPFFLPFLCDRN
jgi:hypothetical protein